MPLELASMRGADDETHMKQYEKYAGNNFVLHIFLHRVDEVAPSDHAVACPFSGAYTLSRDMARRGSARPGTAKRALSGALTLFAAFLPALFVRGSPYRVGFQKSLFIMRDVSELLRAARHLQI